MGQRNICENCFRNWLVDWNTRLKLRSKEAGQRKAFNRQRILESSCVKKETVEIDILVTSRNCDRKIMQWFKEIVTFKEKMYNTMNLYYKYTYKYTSKIIFSQNKYTYTAHQYWGKISKIQYILPLFATTSHYESNFPYCERKLMMSCRQ